MNRVFDGGEGYDKLPKIVDRHLIPLLREQPDKHANQDMASSLEDISSKLLVRFQHVYRVQQGVFRISLPKSPHFSKFRCCIAEVQIRQAKHISKVKL
jgi:hypothetical protein